MKIFKINVQEPYSTYIIEGKKTVEGRLNKGKFAEMQPRDVLKINNQAEYKILAKNQYKNFVEMVTVEGIKNVIPDKETIEEAVQVYYQFFTKEDEERYGVVAIKIVPVVS